MITFYPVVEKDLQEFVLGGACLLSFCGILFLSCNI